MAKHSCAAESEGCSWNSNTFGDLRKTDMGYFCPECAKVVPVVKNCLYEKFRRDVLDHLRVNTEDLKLLDEKYKPTEK